MCFCCEGKLTTAEWMQSGFPGQQQREWTYFLFSEDFVTVLDLRFFFCLFGSFGAVLFCSVLVLVFLCCIVCLNVEFLVYLKVWLHLVCCLYVALHHLSYIVVRHRVLPYSLSCFNRASLFLLFLMMLSVLFRLYLSALALSFFKLGDSIIRFFHLLGADIFGLG